MALVIPAISVLGVVLAVADCSAVRARRLRAQGVDADEVERPRQPPEENAEPNWWILGGGLASSSSRSAMGLGELPYNPGDHLRRLDRDRGLPDARG